MPRIRPSWPVFNLRLAAYRHGRVGEPRTVVGPYRQHRSEGAMSLGQSGGAGGWPFEPYQQTSAPPDPGVEVFPAPPARSDGAAADWTAPPAARAAPMRRDRSAAAAGARDDVRID